MSIKKQPFEELVQRLDASYGLRRWTAAEELARRGDLRAIEPLYAALQQDGPARHAIAIALCALGDDRGFAYLLRRLERRPDDAYRLAPEIAKLGDRRFIMPLLATLDQQFEDSYSRQLAFVSIFEALGKLGPAPEISEKLLQLVNDRLAARQRGARQSIAGVEVAIRVLGDLGEQRAVEPLLALLQTPRETSSDIVKALGRLGDTRAVDPLIKKLKANDEHYRMAVVEALGRLGDRRAVKPLLKLIRDTTRVVYEVAVALGRIGDPDALPALEELRANDARTYTYHLPPRTYLSIKEAASTAIEQIEARMQGAEQEPSLPDALDRLSDSELLERLRDPAALVRAAAAHALAQRDNLLAVEPLLAALHDPHPSVRRNAVDALAEQDDPRVMPVLLAALQDPSGDVRLRIVRKLVANEQLDRETCRAAIVARLRDQEPEVRQSAIGRLIKVWHELPAETLIALLQTMLADTGQPLGDDLQHVHKIIKHLAEQRDARAVPPLLELVRHPYSMVAEAAAWALHEIRDPRAVKPLRELLPTIPPGEKGVRGTILQTLSLFDEPLGQASGRATRGREQGRMAEELGQALLEQLHSPAARLRRQAAEELGGLGEARALAPLLDTLLDDQEERAVRLAAAEAIGKLGDADAVDLLLGMLLDEDEQSELRASAAETLGMRGDQRALPALRALLGPADPNDWEMTSIDEEVLAAALVALGKLGDSERLDRMIWILEHYPDWNVSQAAAEALAATHDPRAIAPLADLLTWSDDDYGTWGAYMLSEIALPQAITPLLQALAHESCRVREVAAAALEVYPTPEVIAALIAALADHDHVGEAAAKTLGKIGNAQTLEQLRGLQPESAQHHTAINEAIRALQNRLAAAPGPGSA